MGKVILIVEDDLLNRVLARDLLELEGYTIIEAVDGKQGVELTKAHNPDLVLMDVQLPVMDGIEAVKLLKSDTATQKIPVVALTAQVMKGDQEEIRRAGCDGYIAKPFHLKEFLREIAKYL